MVSARARAFQYSDVVDQFQVIQKKLGFIEILDVRTDTILPDTDLRDKLTEHVGNCLGQENNSPNTFRVSFVDTIPLSNSGKQQSVIGMPRSENLDEGRLRLASSIIACASLLLTYAKVLAADRYINRDGFDRRAKSLRRTRVKSHCVSFSCGARF